MVKRVPSFGLTLVLLATCLGVNGAAPPEVAKPTAAFRVVGICRSGGSTSYKASGAGSWTS
jgi:hypothetical protein